ncbi:hypothetical protein LZ32DRAFT_274316 [Colletotrichum eremochloae]|nr:hypothetical protein LZ32DRAFT_274316 [Colletotrichum eremochloae]
MASMSLSGLSTRGIVAPYAVSNMSANCRCNPRPAAFGPSTRRLVARPEKQPHVRMASRAGRLADFSAPRSIFLDNHTVYIRFVVCLTRAHLPGLWTQSLLQRFKDIGGSVGHGRRMRRGQDSVHGGWVEMSAKFEGLERIFESEQIWS